MRSAEQLLTDPRAVFAKRTVEQLDEIAAIIQGSGIGNGTGT